MADRNGRAVWGMIWLHSLVGSSPTQGMGVYVYVYSVVALSCM
jgi:hypothetical protein